MGICMSAEQKELAARNAAVERRLQQDQALADRTIKLLLLGELNNRMAGQVQELIELPQAPENPESQHS